MKRCLFSGNETSPCPVPQDWPYGLINQSCPEGKYGQACGAIIAQFIVANTLDSETRASELDEALGLICGQFRLLQTPAGEAPESIREIVGQSTFPLREKRPIELDRVHVSHEDLILTLLNYGDVSAANWYQKYLLEQTDGTQALWWGFNVREGVVYGASAEESWQKTTVKQYDHSFRLGNAALWNSHFPPLPILADPDLGLPKTMPISEHLAKMRQQT